MTDPAVRNEQQLPAWAHTVGPGWAALLARLHEELLALAPDYRIETCQRNLGGLRIWVAERFDMTVRTLQRHLQLAGTSYQQILDELRQELAEHYLTRSDLAVQDIAQYLGFTESRSFHRSFKGWTGMTPGEFRERRKLTT